MMQLEARQKSLFMFFRIIGYQYCNTSFKSKLGRSFMDDHPRRLVLVVPIIY